MSVEKIERILRNTRFTMEMEGFQIGEDQEDIGRKILSGEIKLMDYIARVKQEADSYAYEV